MTRKLKLTIGVLIIAFVAFIGAMWCLDYQSTHETIEIETPEVNDEIKG